MLRRVMPENIHLEFRPDPDTRPVRTDAAQLGQVIMNLAINARDAMPQGGSLVIETANQDVPYSPMVTNPPPGPYTLVRVADTGCGISPEVKPYIFEPFFTTKPEGQGSGLGLATVFGIVKQSGGFLDVATEPGKGSTFTVYLPSVVGEKSAATPETSEPSADGARVVLVAEDEPKIRVLARTILHKAGYTVLEARDAAEALNVAARHTGSIHLLLANIVLPGMSGAALAREMIRQRPGLPVIFSARNLADIRSQADSLVRDTPTLQIPFDPGVLLRNVKAVLDRQLQSK
jgi:CheY-like chemotaxis protein